MLVLITALHSVTSQKTAILIFTAIRSPVLRYLGSKCELTAEFYLTLKYYGIKNYEVAPYVNTGNTCNCCSVSSGVHYQWLLL
jgi:hypothetical protein